MVRVFSAGVVILILFLIFSSSLEAETFKWVDDSGKIHYSDQPLNGKDSEWVDDDEETYFSYEPEKELQSDTASGLPSGKKNRQLTKYRPGLVKAPVGGGVTSLPPAQQTTSERSYTRRQTQGQGTSSTRGSTGRSSSAGRTSTGGY